VTHVAAEAAGVYWKPPWAILEKEFECLPVNVRHVKQVPGRKTDASDVGLASAASGGPAVAQHARKGPEPLDALIVCSILAHLEVLDEAIDRPSDAIEEQLVPLDEWLGCGHDPRRAGHYPQVILGEMGADISAFRTAKHLGSRTAGAPATSAPPASTAPARPARDPAAGNGALSRHGALCGAAGASRSIWKGSHRVPRAWRTGEKWAPPRWRHSGRVEGSSVFRDQGRRGLAVGERWGGEVRHRAIHCGP
jgi:hypothetical protein